MVELYLTFLKIGITFVSFQISGNIPSSKDIFIIMHKGFETHCKTPSSFSSPLALLVLKTSIVVSISCSVQFIYERELSVNLVKGGNCVCSSLTV